MKGIKDYYDSLHKAREAQLLLTGIKLDIFTYLEKPTETVVLAKKMNYNHRNLEIFQRGLVAIGLLDLRNDKFINTESTNKFLNRNSFTYIGDALLYKDEMLSLEGIEARIIHGPFDEVQSKKDGIGLYDFKKLAESTINEMYLGRVQKALTLISERFKSDDIIKILDLGGGNGVLGLEIAKNFPNSTAVIFEHADVADVPKTLIEKNNLGNRVSVIKGDFNKDDIGNAYDFIIASGVMDFAANYLDEFISKIYDSMNPNGYLYLITHGISDEFTGPKEMIVGWMNGRLRGSDLLTAESTILDCIERHNFKKEILNNNEKNLLKSYVFKKFEL